MLVIRDAQLAALGASAQVRHELQLCDLFARTYPRECRQAGGPDAMLRWVRIGLRMASEAGYLSRYQGGRWLSLMMILGVDFAVDPQLPWVRSGLAAEIDATMRLDRLFQETLHYLGATAGEDAELVVRALLRIRAIDFASLPKLVDAEANADACERLRVLYPQKFSFQGLALTAANVAEQRLRARTFGLQTPAGEFLFILLSFMLGSGFDHDPLHGWAGSLLQPVAGVEAGNRAARLEAAAREHLAISLDRA